MPLPLPDAAGLPDPAPPLEGVGVGEACRDALTLRVPGCRGEGVSLADGALVALRDAEALGEREAVDDVEGAGEALRPGTVAKGLGVKLAEVEDSMVGIWVAHALSVAERAPEALGQALLLPVAVGRGEALGEALALPPARLLVLQAVALAGPVAVWETLGLPEGRRDALGDLLALGHLEGAEEAVEWGVAEAVRAALRVPRAVARALPVTAAGVGVSGADCVGTGAVGVAQLLGEGEGEGVRVDVRGGEGEVLPDHVGVAGMVKLALGDTDRAAVGVGLRLAL